jgi:RNA polymerase sigma-70 factor, ECF subfamily
MPATRVLAARNHGAEPHPGSTTGEVSALVARAQAGDAEAFGLVYDRYVGQVFRFVYQRVADRQVAEDLTSETFLRALRNLASFRKPGGDFGAWVTTIARNVVTNWQRSHQRRERPVADLLDTAVVDRAPSPEASVVNLLTREALLAGIEQLNPDQRRCIVLRYLRELSIEETAQALGRTPAAIKSLQHKALRALRGAAAGGGGDAGMSITTMTSANGADRAATVRAAKGTPAADRGTPMGIRVIRPVAPTDQDSLAGRSLEQLLAMAQDSETGRTRQLADRITALVAELTDRLAAERDAETRRRELAEQEAKLTAELAALRQKLGTGPEAVAHRAAIRQWAKDNGYAVRERGRIPRNVVEAWALATGSEVAR